MLEILKKAKNHIFFNFEHTMGKMLDDWTRKTMLFNQWVVWTIRWHKKRLKLDKKTLKKYGLKNRRISTQTYTKCNWTKQKTVEELFVRTIRIENSNNINLPIAEKRLSKMFPGNFFLKINKRKTKLFHGSGITLQICFITNKDIKKKFDNNRAGNIPTSHT